MGLREQMADKPAVAVVIALAVIALAGWYIASQGGTQRAVEQTYYYDLDAGSLFVGDVGKVPPFQTDDDHTAVNAAVFSCGDCADESTRFIGYLEQYSDAYRATMGDEEAFTPEIAEGGHLIASPDAIEWLSLATEQGRALQAEVMSRCGGDLPKGCQP